MRPCSRRYCSKPAVHGYLFCADCLEASRRADAKRKHRARPQVDADGEVIDRRPRIHLSPTLDGARQQLAAHKAKRPDPFAPEFQAWADDKDTIQTHVQVLEAQERNRPTVVILPPEVVAQKLAPKPADPFADLREANIPPLAGVAYRTPPRPEPTPEPEPLPEDPMATPRKTPTERLQTKVDAYNRGLALVLEDPSNRVLRNEANSLKGHVLALCKEYKLTVPELAPVPPLPDPKRAPRPVDAVLDRFVPQLPATPTLEDLAALEWARPDAGTEPVSPADELPTPARDEDGAMAEVLRQCGGSTGNLAPQVPLLSPAATTLIQMQQLAETPVLTLTGHADDWTTVTCELRRPGAPVEILDFVQEAFAIYLGTCPACGAMGDPFPPMDEDGCCAGCGADCSIVGGVDYLTSSLADIKKEREEAREDANTSKQVLDWYREVAERHGWTTVEGGPIPSWFEAQLEQARGAATALEVENVRLGEELDRAREEIANHLCAHNLLRPDLSETPQATAVRRMAQLDAALRSVEADKIQIASLSEGIANMTLLRNEYQKEAEGLRRKVAEMTAQRLEKVAGPASPKTPHSAVRRIRRDMWHLLALLEEMDFEERRAIADDVNLLHAQAEQAEHILAESVLPETA